MQEEKLQALILYLFEKSPFYKEFFDLNHIDISSIKTLEDLTKIPPISKDELQNRNWDFLCVDRNEVIDYTSTSGTMGKPVVIGLTEPDLLRLAYNEFSSFLCADGSAIDTYLLLLTLDRQFMAGIAYYAGLRKLGAGIIRLGPVIPALQWETIQRLQPTALVAVPSMLLKLHEYAREHNLDLKSSSINKIICIGENIRMADFTMNSLGKKISEQWNVPLYSTYASTEMQTAFTECKAGKGGHLQPDLLILEILDDNGFPVENGHEGEATITTLGVEGMPLLRFRTGDLCISHYEKCICGRTTQRISPVLGRKKQMIKFKGTTIYPHALFDILDTLKEINCYVVEIYANEIGNDEIRIHMHLFDYTAINDQKIRLLVQAKLRVTPELRYTSQEDIHKIQRSENNRKPIKLIDKRIKR